VIDHRHVIFVLAVVKLAKRDVTAVRSLDHPGTIPVEFGQITISGSREDVV